MRYETWDVLEVIALCMFVNDSAVFEETQIQQTPRASTDTTRSVM